MNKLEKCKLALDMEYKKILREEIAHKKAGKQCAQIVGSIVIVLVAIYMYTNNYTI